MRLITPLILACTLALALPALASERPDHHGGKSAETLEQALVNLKTYNAKLALLVNKDALSLEELGEVHELTYTLENALAKLRDEHDQLAEVLEQVHKASEQANAETVKNSGLDYLARSEKLIP